jgi:hypothetical protein
MTLTFPAAVPTHIPSQLRPLIEFLCERITEDEAEARAHAEAEGMTRWASPASATKRRMIAAVLACRRPVDEEWVLQILAREYRGAPGYRPEWDLGWPR